MIQERDYEVRFHSGKSIRPLNFADLPAQFKALSWLYGSGEYVSHSNTSVARIFLKALAEQRRGRVHFTR